MARLLDPLDDSLLDLDSPPSPLKVVTDLPAAPRSDSTTEDLEDSDLASGGGFSPPAWSNLSSPNPIHAFWRPRMPLPPTSSPPETDDEDGDEDELEDENEDDDDDDELDDSEDDAILEEAIRTRLPNGSLSPVKGQSPSPDPTPNPSPEPAPETAPEEPVQKPALRPSNEKPTPVQTPSPTSSRSSPQPDNCESPSLLLTASRLGRQPSNFPLPSSTDFRIAVRAEVVQRTKPIEAAVGFIQKRYLALTSSWSTLLTGLLLGLLSVSVGKMLVQPAAPRPAADLVKVAGLARSFEPLIYFSEPAVAHVRELQSTSVAIWDLAESVRISSMGDADPIVQSLDAISETMKELVLGLTRFHTHVDSDIDA